MEGLRPKSILSYKNYYKSLFKKVSISDKNENAPDIKMHEKEDGEQLTLF
jgi:hypothetical protein